MILKHTVSPESYLAIVFFFLKKCFFTIWAERRFYLLLLGNRVNVRLVLEKNAVLDGHGDKIFLVNKKELRGLWLMSGG